MDLFEIAAEIRKNENNDVSAVLVVDDNEGKMCISTTGRFLAQIRGVAIAMITLRNSFTEKFSAEEWNKIWKQTVSEQMFNIKLNKMMEDNDE